MRDYSIWIAIVTAICISYTVTRRESKVEDFLAQARALKAPDPRSKMGGEYEHATFWDEHSDLIQKAWIQYGRKHESLYTVDERFENMYVSRAMRRARAVACRDGNETSVHEMFSIATPGVYVTSESNLFTDLFLRHVVEELDHRRASGIPQRRPNGMNRYGDILSGGSPLNATIAAIVKRYVRPLAQTLFSEYASKETHDMDAHHAFVVRYATHEDRDLALHRDASVVTMNLCLGKAGYEGGLLSFEGSQGNGLHFEKSSEFGAGTFRFSPGTAIFHRGMHRHEALPLISGERLNLIVWLFGPNGDVRVAPYLQESLTLTSRDRWISE